MQVNKLKMHELTYFVLGTLFSESVHNFPLLWFSDKKDTTIYCGYERYDLLSHRFKTPWKNWASIEMYATTVPNDHLLARIITKHYLEFRVQEGL